MSRQVAALVYARKTGSAMRKSILAYMAERANDDGSAVWCSKQRIADEIEASRGAVITNIQAMVDEGLLIEVGKKRHQNGWTMEYSICLRKVAALPAAQKDDPFKIERVEQGPVQEDYATRNPGERQDVQEDDTNLPLTVLEPSSAPAPVREDNSEVLKAIWSAGPQQSRERSSKKRVAESVAKIIRARKDVTPAQLLAAWHAFLQTPDPRKDQGRFCPGIHVWLNDNRFDAFLPSGAAEPQMTPERERILNLERCFYQYGGGGAWRGREFDAPVRPDEPEAKGLYPDWLYEKYRVALPKGEAA